MPNPFDPYAEKRKQSPGEAEVVAGSYLVDLFRVLGVRMPYNRDVASVQRVGELLKRRWRGFFLK